MGKAIPIILAVDVEPDLRMPNPGNPLPWRGYERTHEIIRGWRTELEQATQRQVHFSWFYRMDPQVEGVYGIAAWPVLRYPKLMEELRSQGDELGLHVHFNRWDQSCKRWVVDHGNPQWVEHCLRSSLAAFQDTFGRKCASYRSGDAWMNQNAVDLLEDSGVCFDLSLEPGTESYQGLRRSEKKTGCIPDLKGMPRTPYLPRPGNFKEPDRDRQTGMWMIPISRGEISGWPALAFKAFRRVVNGVHLSRAWVTLYLFQEPYLFRKIVEQIFNSQEIQYLAILSHSQAAIRAYFFRNMKKNLKFLLTHPRAKDFVFSTPAEALSSLQVIPGIDDIRRRA